jgi:hypothetical protein
VKVPALHLFAVTFAMFSGACLLCAALITVGLPLGAPTPALVTVLFAACLGAALALKVERS